MIATGALAFANARVRALRSRLLGHEVAGRVVAGLAATHDDRLDTTRGFRELIEWYRLVLKIYPRGQHLVLALLRRYEIENVKLLWRAVVNHAGTGTWSRHWIDLGRLATFPLDDARDCRTLPSVVEALRATPFAAISMAMWRSHGDDPAAAELGFDKWISQELSRAAAALPAADHTAAQLALAVVRERDLNAARRLDAPPPRAAVTLLALRRQRWELCRRAFRESPFCIAPAIALLLLKEEEVRGLEAIDIFESDAGEPAWLSYALAAGELGA